MSKITQSRVGFEREVLMWFLTAYDTLLSIKMDKRVRVTERKTFTRHTDYTERVDVGLVFYFYERYSFSVWYSEETQHEHGH